MRTILLLLAASCYGSAQSADPSLTFEVASVKVTGAAEAAATSMTARKSVVGSVPASADPTRFSRRRATLASLLLAAYGLKPQELIGPEWLTTERFDIEAKVPEGATAEQQLVMLRNLLAERFQVKVHRETREMAVYEMAIAKGGPKLKESVPGAHSLRALDPSGPFQVSRKDGVPAIVINEQGAMEALAAKLSRQTDRPILDRTGLKGDYDIVLRWTPAAEPGIADADPGISLFGAMESQLGLKLDKKKGSVEVLVVDRAEKTPTPN